MNKLFSTLAFALLCALGTSLALSWYLLEYPVFKADTPALETTLESVSNKVRPLLSGLPESQWDETLINEPYDVEFNIWWYSLDDLNVPIDEQILLLSSKQLITYEADDTPIAELLFPEQQMVVVIAPITKSHRYLNNAVTVLSVLLICIIAAALALIPVARRLNKLQFLAEEYGRGNWLAANHDNSADPIGQLGVSMEDMASQILQLINNNTSLVQDQRELMQAVAHEFRAPMARMRFALEMHDDNTVDEAGSAEISIALDELNDMVSEVLQYARLQISAPDLQLDSLALEPMLTECIAKCKQLYPSTEFLMDVNMSAKVYADPTHLQRAFINLISNAAAYGKQRVEVSVEKLGTCVAVHVDDDGDGIPEVDRRRVLKPFVRLESSRSRRLGGTGLGLAIANGVAIKHAGSISISDSTMGGARLSLILPVGAPPVVIEE